MTTPSPTPERFTQDDLPALADAHDLIEQWRVFLLTRFAAYTRYTEVTPVGGGAALDPIEDPFARTNSGYGSFRLPPNWVRDLLTVDGESAAIVVEHHVSGDRGVSGTTRQYRMPLDFIFGDVERESEYAEYLRLKAKFEPGATNAQQPASADPVDPADPHGRYAAATDLISMLPEKERPPALALLDDTRSDAEEVYAAALLRADASDVAERSSLIARIHALAAVLNLPRRSVGPVTAERIEAARVLAVQARKGNEPEPTSERIESLARPENHDEALLAYERAMTSLRQPHHGGLGDIRHKVYNAARVLGLDTSADAIARAKYGPEKVAAAQRLADSLPPDAQPPIAAILSGSHIAQRAYRLAIDAAEARGSEVGDLSSTSAERSVIHDAAHVLGIDVSALRD